MTTHAKFFHLAVIVSSAVLVSAAFASDWPQFLGPERDGVVHDAKGLARSWPESGPKMLWQTAVGEGYGGAAIFGDSVIILDREGKQSDVLRRIRLQDGQEVWRVKYDAPIDLDHPGSRPTPATDGNMVFSIGPAGHVVAAKFSDGAIVWQKHLLNDWDAKLPAWGVSTSPLLYGDWVIITPWGTKGAVVALKKATGEVVWTTPNERNIVLEYQSPVPMKFEGREMILASARRGYLIGVDAKTGQKLWEYMGFPDKGWNIPCPVVIGDGRIFLTGGDGAGSVMIRLEKAGNEYKVVELWKNKNMGTKTSQALLWKGYIYGNSTDVGGGLRCIGLDGAIKWDSKSSGGSDFSLGNLIIADDLIYLIHGGVGDIYMIEAKPEAYRVLGKAQLLAKPEPWAPLAFKDGKLIVRDQHRLVCLDVAAAK